MFHPLTSKRLFSTFEDDPVQPGAIETKMQTDEDIRRYELGDYLNEKQWFEQPPMTPVQTSVDCQILALIFVRYVQMCCVPLCGNQRCNRFKTIVQLIEVLKSDMKQIFTRQFNEEVAAALIADIDEYIQKAHPECTSHVLTDDTIKKTNEKAQEILQHYEQTSNLKLRSQYEQLGKQLLDLIRMLPHHQSGINFPLAGKCAREFGLTLKKLLDTENDEKTNREHACLYFGLIWNTVLTYFHKAFHYSIYCPELSTTCFTLSWM